MATPSSPASPPAGTVVDPNTRDFYQQISTWLNEFFQLTPFTDIEYSIRSSSTTISSILTTSGGTDGSYTRSFPYEPTNRVSIPSATITSIPPTITEQQQHNVNQTATSIYRSGYIDSLNMLWLSTDQKLYLWKYPTMVDLVELEFDSIVLACNCVRRRKSTTTTATKKLAHSTSFLGSWFPSVMASTPKLPPTLTANDLVEHFVHLLIVLTSQDILIYTIDDQQSNTLQRWYVSPTLKYTLNQIGYFDSLSTSNGRFFLGGQCGDVHEFIYQDDVKSALNKLGQTFLSNFVPTFLQIGSASSTSSNLSSSTVKQITIDDQRMLLYARLANDSVHIYDITTDKGQRLFAYTFDDLINKLKQRQTIAYDDYRPFLTMYTVQTHESSLFNLILVTHTGIRLYYTLVMPTGQSTNDATQQQSRLELIHVRYPPTIPNLPQPMAQQPVFRTGYVDMNCLFLFTTDSNRPQTFGRMILLVNSDSTLLTSTTLLTANFNDSTINQQQQQQQQLQQRPTSEIQSQLFNELFLTQEQISLLTLNIVPLHRDSSSILPRVGPLAQNARYMIQTPDSIVTFDIPRSTEHLRLLLFYDQQVHSLLMKQFFSYYSLRYSCSMSVALTLTSTIENNNNTTRVNDDRIRDLAFQTFLWYSSSAYLQYLETMQQQQQQQLNNFSLDQSRFYQLQPQQPYNRSTTMTPSLFIRQRNFVERYIIPLRINAILFVLSDILRPIWIRPLIELKSLSKTDKTIYYIFHKIENYPETKALLKQLQFFLKKLAPHMCCVWSNVDDLPEYNEQLAQRVFAQQQQQQQQQQLQQTPQQQTSTINNNSNLYLRSALTGQQIHHAHSYPNISAYSQTPFGHSNALNTSLGGGGAADFTLSSPSPPAPSTGSIFTSSMHNLPPLSSSLFPSISTPLQQASTLSSINTNTHSSQQYLLSATSLSSITDLLQEIDYYRTICHMIERLIELLSLWQIINEHRTDMLIERLPESYLPLFNGNNGAFTVRTLLDLDTPFFDTLVAALLTSYEHNEAVFDQLMGRLVDECPKLCPVEKLILYKVDLFLKPPTTVGGSSSSDQHQRLKQACQLYKQVCDRVNITSFCMTLYTFRMYDELVDLCVTAGTKRDPCNQALNYYYGQLDDPQQQQFADVYHRRSECYQALIDILELLYQRDGAVTLKGNTTTVIAGNDGGLTLNEFIRHCLSYDDEFLHVKLFDWLMNKQLNDRIKLYRQVSPYLERFIRYRLKLTNFADFASLDVAISVLQVVKDYTTLCQVLLHLIDLADPHVIFADRLCYLAEALQIARSASAALVATSSQQQPPKSGTDRQLAELIPTLEQRLQTAFVQKQIYADLQMYMNALESHSMISTSINADLQQHMQQISDALTKLDSALFDATELFVDYAQKYELYECQLLLLQLDGNEEPTILQTIWRRLLRKEVNDLFPLASMANFNYERMIGLQHHLVERLRNCRKKRLRLPMDFIRSELKQIVHSLNNASDNGDLLSADDFANQILSDL